MKNFYIIFAMAIIMIVLHFQKQLWQFNEMTYFLKVLYNYDLYKNNISLSRPHEERK